MSAYVKETLEQHAKKRTFRDILDEMFRENPMTGEEREWAGPVKGSCNFQVLHDRAGGGTAL